MLLWASLTEMVQKRNQGRALFPLLCLAGDAGQCFSSNHSLLPTISFWVPSSTDRSIAFIYIKICYIQIFFHICMYIYTYTCKKPLQSHSCIDIRLCDSYSWNRKLVLSLLVQAIISIGLSSLLCGSQLMKSHSAWLNSYPLIQLHLQLSPLSPVSVAMDNTRVPQRGQNLHESISKFPTSSIRDQWIPPV